MANIVRKSYTLTTAATSLITYTTTDQFTGHLEQISIRSNAMTAGYALAFTVTSTSQSLLAIAAGTTGNLNYYPRNIIQKTNAANFTFDGTNTVPDKLNLAQDTITISGSTTGASATFIVDIYTS